MPALLSRKPSCSTINVMAKLVANIMLMLCLWNVVGGSLPAAAAELFADSGVTMKSDDPCAKGGNPSDVHSEEETECDPTNCENEHCRFHQCHVGHCSFVVKEARRFGEFFRDLSSSLSAFDSVLESITPSSLIRPPIA